MNTTTDILSAAELVAKQRAYFDSGATRSVNFRIEQLKRFKAAFIQNEEKIYEALKRDFNKPVFETYTTELGMLLEEIGMMIKNVSKWATPQLVGTALGNLPAKSYIYPDPYGVVLVIGAWNYPLQLTLLPVVGAIAAGNTVVIKPPRVAKHTYQLIVDLIANCFEERYVSCLDVSIENSEMLEQRYDYIFFTGGITVGKIIARAAAEHLTPTTLELGGKSPCIVDETASIEVAARRIMWGKSMNAGQTCVAPDYLLVHEKVKDKLFQAMKKVVQEFYGDDASKSVDYPSIINDKHFDRLSSMIKDGRIVLGGKVDAAKRHISPTVITDIDLDHPLMADEIFGPILPAFTFNHLDEAFKIVKSYEKPLAFYVFSNSYKNQQRCMNEIQFGGGCINDTVAHLLNEELPFGGVGSSGVGAYHGKFSFDTFTHFKGVMNKVTWPDVPLRYPPYHSKLGIIKKVIN
ncbi:MAG: aldehyde dehydrogenase [Chitinophagales bacterium]|nr:aldehyde dehydrogenase [Chitinophagales bacterium]